MDLFESLKQKVSGKGMRIVFPEATDARILNAVVRLHSEGLVVPILIGNQAEVHKAAENYRFNLDGIDIIDPADYSEFDQMVASFVERRNGKATEEQAREILTDVNYFGTMLVYMGKADGLVSGAAHSTADTVRPALQIIKTREGVSRTSGAFIMLRGQERYLFADCAINPNPDAQVLSEIAIESARTAEMFDIDPKVAMLSFSTKGSASGEQADKVIEATKLAKEQNPDLAIDGELQFDAAFVSAVAQAKAPGSDVAGQAKVFVFPELQAGNIGYKIAQRLGGFEAVGPILQGLNQPISDLSRGCVEEDVYKTAIITANQALMND
ncbi:phosphate acetyltransferase [Dolosigranulum savutiense]|uniref:Phosphate acetyltransferase n=1 Tax=Dolosigranulum savutiense TaxID=3110288 RepID=A0AB74TJM3_9LACT